MPRKAKAKKNGKGRKVRFPGIVAAAEALGVTRVHLYLVLSGKRESASLRARYLEWMNQQPNQGSN